MTNQQNSANSTATWIWYPGDYEIWLGNKVNNRRTDRGAFFPPFWKQDSHYVTVEFSTTLSLAKEETVTLAAEGKYNIKLVGVHFGEEDGQKTLFVTIDSEKGVDIDLCVEATHIVDPIIDSLDLDIEDYVLDVGSKGVSEDEN